ncbi:hydrogenase expression/formation C-terminal domain-containing protein [Propionivibrio sp.]|uniref:hydrogenase expression/formation C-terminal domain-containing protein n=1 Tax=Propionivibrio sp. TaxID=2212460 RepID=UPI003BF13CEF
MNSGCDEANLTRYGPEGNTFSAPLFSGAEVETLTGTSGFHSGSDTIRQSHPIIWMRAVTPALSIDAQPDAAAKAIFSEVKTGAGRLLELGETHSIDLRFMKSMPEERATLARLLGRGEVSAVVDSVGRSEIQETAIPCVWLIRHYNSEDEIVGELIEIADIPEILVGDRQAVAHCLKVLNANALPGAN